jgi:hypothetical protein
MQLVDRLRDNPWQAKRKGKPCTTCAPSFQTSLPTKKHNPSLRKCFSSLTRPLPISLSDQSLAIETVPNPYRHIGVVESLQDTDEVAAIVEDPALVSTVAVVAVRSPISLHLLPPRASTHRCSSDVLPQRTFTSRINLLPRHVSIYFHNSRR